MNGNDGQIVIFGVVGVFVCVLTLSLHRRRFAIAQHLRHRFIVIGSYLLALIIAAKFTDPSKALLIAIIVGAAVWNRTYPRRSRYIPRRERRRAIARFELSGERYDSKKHEIDHVIPHSRWGVNSADNLRVVARERNRAKAAKSPWWDVLGKI